MTGRQISGNLYNSRVGGLDGLLLHFPASGLVLEQTIEPIVPPYRRDYRWAIDELLMPDGNPPQERVGTSRFQITFGATARVGGRTIGFVERSGGSRCEPEFGLWSEFVTGQVVLPRSTAAAC